MKTCMITGESSDEHLMLAEGNVVLSRRAAIDLLRELEGKVG